MENVFDNFILMPILSEYKNILSSIQLKKISKEYTQVFEVSFPSKNVDLSKLDYILKKNFGKKADKINHEVMSSVLQFEHINKELWFVSEDIEICLKILNSYGDAYKKIILDTLINTSNVTLNLTDKVSLPQASGYRRIKELIHDGLLVVTGTHTKGEGRKAIVYSTLFEGVGIWMVGESMKVHFKVKEQFLADSFTHKVLQKIKTDIPRVKI